MKMIIEVEGGIISNITATDECSIYIIDHDVLKERGIDNSDYGDHQAQQPDCIYWDETDFNEALQQLFAEYEEEDRRPIENWIYA